MKLTLKEMNGLLNGKCLPSDLIVGETLAEYLVRKFADFEQKLAVSEREFRAADATIENMQMQVEKLRTANAGLCAVLTNANACYKAAVFEGLMGALEESSGTNLADIVTRRLLHIPEPITYEATDAYLAEVRAQGVAMFSDWLIERIHGWQLEGVTPEDLLNFHQAVTYASGFAAQLRKGAQS